MYIIAWFRFLFHQFFSLWGKNFLGAPVKFCMFNQSIAIRESCPAQRTAIGLLSLRKDNEGRRPRCLKIWNSPSVFSCARWAVVLSCRWNCTPGTGRAACPHDPLSAALTEIFNGLDSPSVLFRPSYLPFCPESFLTDFTMFWIVSIMNLQMEPQCPQLLECLVTLSTVKSLIYWVCLKETI